MREGYALTPFLNGMRNQGEKPPRLRSATARGLFPLISSPLGNPSPPLPAFGELPSPVSGAKGRPRLNGGVSNRYPPCLLSLAPSQLLTRYRLCPSSFPRGKRPPRKFGRSDPAGLGAPPRGTVWERPQPLSVRAFCSLSPVSGRAKRPPRFPQRRKSAISRAPCVASFRLSTSSANDASRPWLPAAPSRRAHVENIVIRFIFFTCLGAALPPACGRRRFRRAR